MDLAVVKRLRRRYQRAEQAVAAVESEVSVAQRAAADATRQLAEARDALEALRAEISSLGPTVERAMTSRVRNREYMQSHAGNVASFRFVIDGAAVVVEGAALWELDERLNVRFGDMIGQHEPVYFEGVEIADLIEIAVDGDRPAELELDDVYLEAIDQVLAPDDHATWPALHELADAVHAARRRRASTHG